jgi:hypothetical protein
MMTRRSSGTITMPLGHADGGGATGIVASTIADRCSSAKGSSAELLAVCAALA